MAITWNNIAAPNFSAANELFKQAQDNLLNVGATLTATAQGYQDAIRKRNTGLIQEYINSARTPEELQSEAFQVGYQNLVNTLDKEYDPVAMNQYKDSRGDVLTKRASDALTLKSNEFTFGRNQKKANTEDAMAKLLTMPIGQREAAAAQLAKDGTFDPNVFQQYLQGEGAIRNQDNTNKLFNATYAATVENENLKPTVTRHGMLIADRTAATAEKNARTNELEALAKLSGSDDKNQTEFNKNLNEVLTGFSKDINTNRVNTYENDKGKHPYTSPADWQEKEGGSKKGKYHQWLGNTSWVMRNVEKFAKEYPAYLDMPPHIQASVLDLATGTSKENDNTTDSQLWIETDARNAKLRTYLEDAIKNYSQTKQVGLIQEKAIKQQYLTRLQREFNLSKEQAEALLEKELTGVPKLELPTDTKETEQEKSNKIIERNKANPTAVLVSDASKQGAGGLILKQAADASPINYHPVVVTEEDNKRLSLLSEFADLKQKLSLVKNTPEATKEAQNAVVALHLEQAKLGKLDALTSDRYVQDIEAKLKSKSLDAIKRKRLEQQLQMFKYNQRNTYGIND